MSSKGTKAKSTSKSQPSSTNVEQTPELTTVASAPSQVSKGGKKSKKEEPVVEATPVTESTPTPAPVSKGGKKSKKEEPVEATPTPAPAQAPAQVTKGGKKSKKEAETPVVEATANPVQKASKVAVENADAEDEEEQVGGRLRYFKLFYNNEFQGRYCGKKPKQAANKAFSSIIKEMKKNGNQEGGVNMNIDFSIRECTRNSRHKEYKYVGIRETLKEPVEVKINNEDGSVKKITYNFHNKIQKAPKA